MGFTSLGLSAPIQKAIAEKGYTEPSPIQAQAIPAVLAGKDVMAAAQTGTTAGWTESANVIMWVEKMSYNNPYIPRFQNTGQSISTQLRALFPVFQIQPHMNRCPYKDPPLHVVKSC